MKKTLFYGLCLLLVCVLAFSLAACGEDDASAPEESAGSSAGVNVEGTYYYDEMNESVTLKDGKWSIYEGEWELLTGTYEVKGNSVLLYETGESEPLFIGSLDGNALDLGVLGVYTRK